MVNLKPANQSSQKTPNVDRRGFSFQKLFWFILASVLVHGLGLLIWAQYQRSQLSVKPEIESKAIELVTIPEESEAEPPPKTKKRAEENSVAEQNLEAESTADNKPASPPPTPPPPPPKPPEPVAQPKPVEPKPVAEAPPPQPAPPKPPEPVAQPKPPEPKPIEPKPVAEAPPPQPEVISPPITKQPPVLSGSDISSTPIPKPAPPETESPVATSLPPKSEPVPNPEPTPTTDVLPETSENSASSLLGGDYKKTLANGGAEAFFSPEAISLNAVLDPSQINALKDFDYNGYLAGVRETLRPNWNPDRTKIQSTVLKVELNRSGQIMKLEIARSSGSELFDQTNLETFRKSAPFDILPPEFPLESFKFQFEFSIID